MPITKQKKQELFNEFSGILTGAKAAAFVQFKGLSVKDATDLRIQLRDEGVGYKVVKKTLLKRALDAGKVEGIMPEMEGNIALAWSDTDLTAPARGVYDFSKKHKENIALVGGIFEGRYMDAVAISEIAMIPSMQVLRGMFVNVINSPIQGIVCALARIAEKKSS